MFKLILGLGNKDIETVKKIAQLYAKYNIEIIDCNASVYETIRQSVQEATGNSNIKFCVSVALMGDTHNKKAKINKNCKQCLKCVDICSQKAIYEDSGNAKINSLKCCGCKACLKVCKNKAIDIYETNTLFDDLEIIKKLKIKPEILEVHLSIKKKKKILKDFEEILKQFRGDVSVCLSRKYFGTSKTIKLLEQLKEIFDKYNPDKNFCVQLDGASNNNANAEYSSNLEALAFYNEVKHLDYNFLISGGINDKIIELCKLFNLKPQGLVFGSFARKIAQDENKVKKLIDEVNNFYKS